MIRLRAFGATADKPAAGVEAGLPRRSGPRSWAAEAGLTLVEVTLMLIISMSIIGALVPTVAATIRRAETIAATTAMTNIRTQILLVLGDIEFTAFTINGVSNGTVVQLLVSDGDTPRECTAIATACASWQAAVDNTTGLADFIERHLNTNDPRGSAANDYPTIETLQSDAIWKGPYLNSPVFSDPWGNRFMVNVQFLGASTNDVVVLSAGPDEVINTAFAANPLAAGGDDIIVLVEA